MIYKGMKQGQSGTYVYTQIEVDKSRVIGRVSEIVNERKEMRRKDTERGRIGREKELKREREETRVEKSFIVRKQAASYYTIMDMVN